MDKNAFYYKHWVTTYKLLSHIQKPKISAILSSPRCTSTGIADKRGCLSLMMMICILFRVIIVNIPVICTNININKSYKHAYNQTSNIYIEYKTKIRNFMDKRYEYSNTQTKLLNIGTVVLFLIYISWTIFIHFINISRFYHYTITIQIRRHVPCTYINHFICRL